jgi:hypothetical protein
LSDTVTHYALRYTAEKGADASRGYELNHPKRVPGRDLDSDRRATLRPGRYGPMDPTPEQLETLKMELSSLIAETAAKQKDLDELLNFLTTIRKEHRLQLFANTYSARTRRGKARHVRSTDEEQSEYEKKWLELEKTLGNMWYKLCELQEKERGLDYVNKLSA